MKKHERDVYFEQIKKLTVAGHAKNKEHNIQLDRVNMYIRQRS